MVHSGDGCGVAAADNDGYFGHQISFTFLSHIIHRNVPWIQRLGTSKLEEFWFIQSLIKGVFVAEKRVVPGKRLKHTLPRNLGRAPSIFIRAPIGSWNWRVPRGITRKAEPWERQKGILDQKHYWASLALTLQNEDARVVHRDWETTGTDEQCRKSRDNAASKHALHHEAWEREAW